MLRHRIAFAAFPRAAGVTPPLELLAGSHWFACRTRSRSEKKVSAVALQRGIETFLPLIELDREWRDRTKRVALPLLPGYLFVRSSLSDLPLVLHLPGVVSIADPNGYPTPVKDAELRSVRILVAGVNETGTLPQPADFLEVGDEVIVQEGPFRGMSGILMEHRSGTRVAIRISALRQATSVELDRAVLRPAA
jgi:transcription antitermination factor NusG